MNDFNSAAGGVSFTADPQMSERMVKAVESRADVESLEALHTERRKILPEYSKLAAMFKSGTASSADSRRKQHRALIATRYANDHKGDKPLAETALERMANADVEHIAYCEKLERDFIEFTLLDFKLTEIGERIRSRETELQTYNAELRLSR